MRRASGQPAGSGRVRRHVFGDGADNPFLTRLRLLTAIGDTELTALEHLLTGKRHIRARSELVNERGADPRLHVLLDGWACRYRLLADGRRQITMLLVPGDICNLDVLHVRNSHEALATLTPCTVAGLDPATVRSLADRSPRVADAFGWLGAVENAVLAERNTSLGRRSAREHLAHLLCELHVRLAAVGRAQDLRYTLSLTQEEIADVLGLTAVHVNRTLQGLRGAGLIELHGHALVIRDWDALQRTAGFRADYLHLEGVDGTSTRLDAPAWAPAMPAQRAAAGTVRA